MDGAVPTFRFHEPSVTPEVFERKLRGWHPHTRDGRWTERFRAAGLRLDLSRVEHIDYSVLAHLALLAESALRHRIAVRVALPLTRPRTTEIEYVASAPDLNLRFIAQRRIDSKVRRRKAALTFLRNTGFIEALRPPHVPGVDELCTLEFDHDPRQAPAAGPPATASPGAAVPDVPPPTEREPAFPRNIIPLEWVPFDDAEALRTWEQAAMRMLTLRGDALTTGDALAVATIVLRELLDNVREHAPEEEGVSCPPAALAGGVVIRRQSRLDGPVGKRGLDGWADYADWVTATEEPVIRLVVGDSGRGICSTLPLARGFDGPAVAGSRNERTLFWSLTPWSSGRRRDAAGAPAADRAKKGVRGLASVRRTIHQASGALLLRSADAVAGYAYPEAKRSPLSRGDLAWTPGTLVDIVLVPTAPLPVARDEQSPAGPAQIAAVVPLRAGPDGAIDVKSVLVRLGERLEQDGGRIVAVVGQLPAGKEDRYEFCVRLLELADELADRAGLLLIVPGRSSLQLGPALRDFDDTRIMRGEGAASPVMVIGARDDLHCLGVDSSDAELFHHAAQGPVDLRDEYVRLGQGPVPMQKALERMSRWLAVEDDAIRLRLRPAAINGAIAASIRGELAGELPGIVRRARPGSVLVTPTLETVDRWLDPEELIERLGGAELTGHVLGRWVAQGLPGERDPRLALVRVGELTGPMARTFGEALPVLGREIALLGEVGLEDDPGAPVVRADMSFVCLTDILISGNHVSHAIQDLMRAHARPLAIAALLDGRRKSRPTMRVLGEDIPVHALLHDPLVVDGVGKAKEPIDLIRVPRGFRPPPRPEPSPIDQGTLLDWLEETPEALLTGHIARFARRHFFTFLQAVPLLQEPGARRAIGNRAVDEIAAWIASADGSELARIVIVHPSAADGPTGRFAEVIREAWRAAGSEPPIVDSMPIRRVVVGGRNVLPTPMRSLPPRTGVIVADWGAVSLHTLQELLRIAVDMGAASVLALVLASQLSEADQIAAQQLRRVSGSAWSDDGLAPESAGSPDANQLTLPTGGVPADPAGAIPATVRFLSSFHVGFADAGACDVCEYAREYDELADVAPSPSLRAHAQETAAALEPQDLDDARRGGPRDALRHDLDVAEAVAIARRRQELEQAHASTESRLALEERIGALAPAETDTFVRLLMLEPKWLKLAPLRFTAMRDAIVAALLRRMRGPDFSQLPVTLQRQYVMALRAVSKDAFLEELPPAFGRALARSESVPVAMDLLWGVFTLTRRSYASALHRRRAWFRLFDASKAVDRPGLESDGDVLDAMSALESLIVSADSFESLQRVDREDVQAVWVWLQREYGTRAVSHELDHHTSISTVVLIVETGAASSRETWTQILELWRYTARFLAEYVLPLLPHIRDIVLARLYDPGYASSEDVARWRSASTAEVLRELGEIDQLLTRFVRDPGIAPLKREEVDRLVRWWYDFFFKSEPGGLPALLEACPCRLADAVSNALRSAIALPESDWRPVRVTPAEGDGDVMVFCHSIVFDEVIRQLVANAAEGEHARTGGAAEVTLRVVYGRDGGMATVTVINDETRATETPGRGLRMCERQLRPYGATVRPVEFDAPWTFAVRIDVPIWGVAEHERA